MTISVQSGSGNLLSTNAFLTSVLAKDSGAVSREDTQDTLAPFQDELDSLFSDAKAQLEKNPRQPQGKRAKTSDEVNLLGTSPVAVADIKKEALPPPAFALPTLQWPATPQKGVGDEGQAQPPQPGVSDPAAEVVNLNLEVLDAKVPDVNASVLPPATSPSVTLAHPGQLQPKAGFPNLAESKLNQPELNQPEPNQSETNEDSKSREIKGTKGTAPAVAPRHAASSLSHEELVANRTNQPTPPTIIAIPALEALKAIDKAVTDTRPVPADQPPATEASQDIPDLKNVATDAKSTEVNPPALAFAARLSSPAFGAAATNQIKLQPLPSRQNVSAPDSIRPAAPARVPDKAPATVTAVSGTAQMQVRRDKSQEITPVEATVKSISIAPRQEIQSAEVAATSETQVPPPAPSVTAQMDRVLEPAAAPTGSSHDIRVHVPDNNGGSTEVRFQETAGEVRVSVRTANSDLAQTLRGGLDDLTHKLSNEGIRTEVWHPGVQASTAPAQSDSAQQQPPRQQSQQDQHGAGEQNSSGNGSGGSGSDSRGQRDSQERKPRWVEEFEESTSDRKN